MAGIVRPYDINLEFASITGSSYGTDSETLGSNEQFTAYEMIVVSATGTFTLEITDQAGNTYQNEAVRYGTGTTTYYPLEFKEPLVMKANSKFSFKVTDTSGSTNTVYIKLRGKKEFL